MMFAISPLRWAAASWTWSRACNVAFLWIRPLLVSSQEGAGTQPLEDLLGTISIPVSAGASSEAMPSSNEDAPPLLMDWFAGGEAATGSSMSGMTTVSGAKGSSACWSLRCLMNKMWNESTTHPLP